MATKKFKVWNLFRYIVVNTNSPGTLFSDKVVRPIFFLMVVLMLNHLMRKLAKVGS